VIKQQHILAISLNLDFKVMAKGDTTGEPLRGRASFYLAFSV
jgi:hypothetical protein